MAGEGEGEEEGVSHVSLVTEGLCRPGEVAVGGGWVRGAGAVLLRFLRRDRNIFRCGFFPFFSACV